MRKQYRLPDGTCVASATKYVKEWRKLGSAVTEATNGDYELYAFDPSLAFKAKGNYNSVTISVYIANLLAELVEKRKLLAAQTPHLGKTTVSNDAVITDFSEWGADVDGY